MIASDTFAQRARHPEFPRAFTRARKPPLPALIAVLLSMRSASQQTLFDTFFANLCSGVNADQGAGLVRAVFDRAFAWWPPMPRS